MVGWIEKKVRDIAPLQRGFDLPKKNIVEGKYPIVYSNGVGGYHKVCMAKAPGLVTGRSGTIGTLHFVEQDYWPHNTTLWVTDFKGNDPKYIYYLYQIINWKKYASGSGVPTLNRNDIHDTVLYVPESLSEQCAIAAVLTETDSYISVLERFIAKKCDIKQGAIQELLCPKDGWTDKKLGNVLTVSHGKSQKNVEEPMGKYPILATGGEIGRTNVALYDKTSVLIGRKGTIDKPQYTEAPFWTIDTLFYTIIKQDYSTKYIYYLFCTINWAKYNEASGVPSLSAKTIENIEIKIPQLPEQNSIAGILSDMDAEISTLAAKLNKAKLIKQGMMDQLLTGKIRLEAESNA